MRIAVLLNTASGTFLDQPDLEAEIGRRLAEADLDLVPVDAAGDLSARLDRALAEKPDMILVGGGDGTIAAAAHRLAGTDTVLGLLPLGTMNKLAKDLGVPLEIEAAIATLTDGETRRIDVGEVNGTIFMRNSVLGFPSRIAVRREERRGKLGWVDRWRLGVAIVRALYRYPALDLVLEGHGRKVAMRTRMLAVANNAYDEGVGRVLEKASLDAGELVIYALPDVGVGTLARLMVGMLMGDWRTTPGLLTERVKGITVTTKRQSVRVMNDGEPQLLTPPLHFTIRPGALAVRVPASAANDPPHPASDAPEPLVAQGAVPAGQVLGDAA